MEHNIDRIVALEMMEGQRLGKVYKEAFQVLDAKIAVSDHGFGTSKETFTQARAKVVREQIQETVERARRGGNKVISKAFGNVRRTAGDDTKNEVERFENEFKGIRTPIPHEAIALSTDPRNFLLNRFKASMDAYDDGLRSTMERILSGAIVKRDNYSQAAASLRREIHGIDKWRLARIARTELHYIYNVSKVDAMRSIRRHHIPGLMKGLVHPMDGRTAEDSKELADLNPVIPIDNSFKYTYRGQKREFFAPPDRPNDRAVLVPIDKAWQDSKK